ncbi:hypothetical protein O6H91_14G066600 [Diphasiastrum complanatum]|uniref:Uncharacterized protein n=1 Tax=Diphasiastrum complanatum TaxID=34168 RepID=A0ACC2BQJ8_DIPCM|nr:hypothetical protein O6H91_14G066600 [Diphasiastrum complanatum]
MYHSQFSLGNNASRVLRACWNCVAHSSENFLQRREWMLVASCRSQTDSTKLRLVKKKRRLDEVCVERFPQFSRNLIQSWILQGKVLVDGKSASKAGMQVLEASKIDLIAKIPKYVCRAGYKLEAAIKHFGLNLEGIVVLDSGLSTGGFTDCLLQHGAAFVYGVDVGYGQVAERIRINKKVCVMERTNLRYLPALPKMVDLVTLDLSFISLLLVMPAVCAVMKQQSDLITLIKPQFEARRSQVGGGGIVRDAQVHKEVLEKVVNGVENFGFACKGWIESPIKGAEGNLEFLAHFERCLDLTISTTTLSSDRLD